MNILEKEIEDIIWETLKIDGGPQKLSDRGLYHAKYYRSFLRQPKIGNYGIADLVGFRYNHTERCLKFGVFELKRQEINIDVLMQCLGYCQGINEFIQSRYPSMNLGIRFNLILIGSKIDTKTSFCYFRSIFENIITYTFNIDLEKGLTFKRSGDYYLTEKGFERIDPNIISVVKKEFKDAIRESINYVNPF